MSSSFYGTMFGVALFMFSVIAVCAVVIFIETRRGIRFYPRREDD